MKVAIIKLGALGDVVRTLPILLAIKEKYPNSEITWITKPNAEEIVSSSPYVKQTYTVPISQEFEKFDILYNFDIDNEATKLASEIRADKKYGFYSEEGFASAFNFPAEYYLNTLFDDELKNQNKKTYQQMMFDAAELEYKKQEHPIYLTEQDKEYAEQFLNENNISNEKIKDLIGIHFGASSKRWPSKSWADEKIIEFVQKASQRAYKIIIFAGSDDKEKQEKIFNDLKKRNPQIEIYKNNPQNTIKQFASLVNLCQKMICFDSLALHISLALKKPTIALFFCTSPNEVEDYGILKKIVSPMLNDFFPEKMDKYSEELVNSISVEEVLNALEN